MYVTTGLLTGILLVVMFMFRPESILRGRFAMAALGLAAILGTLPRRKGMAIALELWIEERVNRRAEKYKSGQN